MRGQQERRGSLFFYLLIEDRIPANHPLRRIRKLADQATGRLNPAGTSLARAHHHSWRWLKGIEGQDEVVILSQEPRAGEFTRLNHFHSGRHQRRERAP